MRCRHGYMVVFRGANGLRYPLVMTNITMENHHLQWIVPLIMVIFHAMLNCPRVPQVLWLNLFKPLDQGWIKDLLSTFPLCTGSFHGFVSWVPIFVFGVLGCFRPMSCSNGMKLIVLDLLWLKPIASGCGSKLRDVFGPFKYMLLLI